MSAPDAERFAAIRRRHLEVRERERRFRETVLLPKYGAMRPPSQWLNRTEQRRLEALDRAEDRTVTAMMTVLDEIGGRNWRAGAPLRWVMGELTYEDAITTGELSSVPPPAYGYSARDMQRFAAAAPEPSTQRSRPSGARNAT